jgi:hypothetical protein
MFVGSPQENARPIFRRSPAVSPYVGRLEIAPCGECVKIAPERTSIATYHKIATQFFWRVLPARKTA